jgi:hypothetical protein
MGRFFYRLAQADRVAGYDVSDSGGGATLW